jgi:hypothetical protein
MLSFKPMLGCMLMVIVSPHSTVKFVYHETCCPAPKATRQTLRVCPKIIAPFSAGARQQHGNSNSLADEQYW